MLGRAPLLCTDYILDAFFNFSYIQKKLNAPIKCPYKMPLLNAHISSKMFSILASGVCMAGIFILKISHFNRTD